MNPTLGHIGAAMGGLAARTMAAFERGRIRRRIARFSDSRLCDIGMERDWDGSVLNRGKRI